MGEIIFNGRSSREIGLEVETFPTYQAPKRSYEKIHIPGRLGDIIIDQGSWENVVRKYSVSIGSLKRDYHEMVNKVIEWLHPKNTYARLEDSYEPDYYRLAVFLEEIEFTNLFNHGGKADISFDCKPQRFLKIGEEPIVLTNGMEILNPTAYTAFPYLTVYGTSGYGSVRVHAGGSNISDITFRDLSKNHSDHAYVDCETQDAYAGTTNLNSNVHNTYDFLRFFPGINKIEVGGGLTKVEAIPRWYTI